MSISIDVSEGRALASRFTTLSGRLGARAAAVLRKTAFDIEADAKALAPVDTGALRASISTTVTGDGRNGSMTAEIGPTVEYGVFQEFGTSTQPGQPYLGPAYDRRIEGYSDALASIIEESI